MIVPATGMALVVAAVLFAGSLPVRLFLVVAGLMLTEAGFWRLADPLLPDERRYTALRAETDHFTALVRQLNTAALEREEGDPATSGFALEEIRTEMHRAVDRMVTFAGMADSDVSDRKARRPGRSDRFGSAAPGRPREGPR